MRGKERTRPTDDLSYIFFKIRETRDDKTRRSWQRRARLALAKRTDLTPAERHEVCAVWSRSDCQHIDSPALSKCLGLNHIKFEGTAPAQSVMRRRFDSEGQPLEKKELNGYNQHTRQRLQRLCIRALSVVHSRLGRACYRPLQRPQRGSDGLIYRNDGNRQRPSYRREQTPQQATVTRGKAKISSLLKIPIY